MFFFKTKTVLSICALLCAHTTTLAAVSAFPGADGYGKNAIGGRGGDVIWVTNLNNSGAGSFREAVQAHGPRIIVFRVAGIIELESPIYIKNPYITIAGQTAPGDGICIKFKPSSTTIKNAITIHTHDVIIRYLRIRCGLIQGNMDNASPFHITEGKAGTIMENIILDHCSSSWHPGRTGITIWPASGATARNITLQRFIASEAPLGGDEDILGNSLARGAFLFGNHDWDGKGTVDGVIDRITLYENLTAHTNKRNPEVKTYQADGSHYMATFQIINNVVYNFIWAGSMLAGNEATNEDTYHFTEEEVCHYNIFGNYYKRNENSNFNRTEISITPGVRLYVGDNKYGNIGPARTDSSQDPWHIVSFTNYSPDILKRHAPGHPYQVFSPFHPESLPHYQTAQDAYTDVLDDVGANMGLNADGSFRDERDAVDIRIINDVRNNTGSRINTPEDVGGWPSYNSGDGPYPDSDADGMSDTWEEIKFSSLSRNGKLDFDGDGYTDLEEFLNGTDPINATLVSALRANPNGHITLSTSPNPFNTSVSINFKLHKESMVSIHIFDLNGRLVKNLVNSKFNNGSHKFIWNAKNRQSGTYLIKLKTDDTVINRTITLIK